MVGFNGLSCKLLWVVRLSILIVDICHEQTSWSGRRSRRR